MLSRTRFGNPDFNDMSLLEVIALVMTRLNLRKPFKLNAWAISQ
jgi:hypothetical protein